MQNEEEEEEKLYFQFNCSVHDRIEVATNLTKNYEVELVGRS